jgi:hypothetical protein
MYQINREQNNIIQLNERLFAELNFRERDHLQEWIAKNPEVLGEDLLIIQKEFNGFSETNERLDLLALDKEGNVVVIENKLDDSGRDVVWQALKYASYCSTLSTSQIIKIYQTYLDSNAQDGDAKAAIVDFLEIEDEESLVLNRNDQRIIFVANHYRKEVTSTVLWLLDHDVRIQCFRATPYSLGEALFLQIEQIIPVPEVSEFIIDIKEKEREDKGKSKKVAQTEADLLEFWQQVQTRFSQKGLHFFDNIKPKPKFRMGFTKSNARFAMAIGRTGPRVEVCFNNDMDKRNFDALSLFADELNAAFDGQLEWQRLDDKKASRVKYEISYREFAKTVGEWEDPACRPGFIEWFVTELERFHSIVFPVWEKAQRELGK